MKRKRTKCTCDRSDLDPGEHYLLCPVVATKKVWELIFGKTIPLKVKRKGAHGSKKISR